MSVAVDVYVHQLDESERSLEELSVLINEWIEKFKSDAERVRYFVQQNREISFTEFDESLNRDIAEITVSFLNDNHNLLDLLLKRSQSELFDRLVFVPHIFKLHTSICSQSSSVEGEETNSALCTSLPAAEFQGIWQNLFFDHSIKNQLINFVLMSILFADRNVDQNIISWNKVVLLYGPPGTGKTSLCKALAQTLSVKLYNRFQSSKLIEINSHSLFSRWFSESGKLIVKLFNEIQEYISDPQNLAFVLIDEVESLVHTRQMLMSGNDPSDAMRVVNALLTEIDKIKNYTNVVILTTSNIIGAIDVAFVDRADIKQYIGFPNEAIIYEIYRSCLNELTQKNLVSFSEEILPYTELKLVSDMSGDAFCRSSKYLQNIAAKSHTLSGRILRKLSFVAIACYSNGKIPVAINDFLEMLEKAVQKHFEDVKSASLLK